MKVGTLLIINIMNLGRCSIHKSQNPWNPWNPWNLGRSPKTSKPSKSMKSMKSMKSGTHQSGTLLMTLKNPEIPQKREKNHIYPCISPTNQWKFNQNQTFNQRSSFLHIWGQPKTLQNPWFSNSLSMIMKKWKQRFFKISMISKNSYQWKTFSINQWKNEKRKIKNQKMKNSKKNAHFLKIYDSRIPMLNAVPSYRFFEKKPYAKRASFSKSAKNGQKHEFTSRPQKVQKNIWIY